MRILVTGSTGHLGEALMRALAHSGHEVVGIDIKSSPFTHRVGTITDRNFVARSVAGMEAILHTATLHKPHIATHTCQEFVETNVTGTLLLLEEAAAAGVRAFVFTSTTSTFGHALRPPASAPAAWINEDVTPVPRNIYGITKLAAENLCELIQHSSAMPVMILRTSRFFPEADDDKAARAAYEDDNLKVSELLYRRADIEDVVSAHLCALERAPAIGFGRYIISATTPFTIDDLHELRVEPAGVVDRRVPAYAAEYARRGWSMVRSIDRVYDNERARRELGWQPRYDFAYVIERLRTNEDFRSPLARAIGCKGYHAEVFAEGPYPIKQF
jgi:UDP-glucose 4-epimerase